MSDRAYEVFHKTKIVLLVVLPLAGTIAAVLFLWERYVFWSDLWILLGMYTVTTMGVTIGYHRMLTHQGFQAPEWLRGIVLVCGAMAYEGQPIAWTTAHIMHHAHSDEEGDPHSPLHGFWHAHFGWLFSSKNFPDPRTCAPHLLEDRTVVFVERLIPLWLFLALLIPYLLGGWTGLLWGGAVRIFLTTHITWSVNSVCHTFGRRPFETTDESRNHWVVGLLGFGEGWHNNHHAFPQSAFHGLRWWQLDCSGLMIRFFEWVGLAWDVQRVSAEMMEGFRRQSDRFRSSAQDLRSQFTVAAERVEGELQVLFSSVIDDSIASVERMELLSLKGRMMERLHAMRHSVSRASHLKRQRIAAYLREVQSLSVQARDKVARLSGPCVVS